MFISSLIVNCDLHLPDFNQSLIEILHNILIIDIEYGVDRMLCSILKRVNGSDFYKVHIFGGPKNRNVVAYKVFNALGVNSIKNRVPNFMLIF